MLAGRETGAEVRGAMSLLDDLEDGAAAGTRAAPSGACATTGVIALVERLIAEARLAPGDLLPTHRARRAWPA